MKEVFEKFIYKNDFTIGGLTNELNLFYILNYFNNNSDDVLVVTNSLFEATKLFNLLQTYTSDILLYPMDDFLTSVLAIKSPELKFTRLETVKTLKKSSKKIIITNLMGYLHYLPSKNDISEYTLKIGQEINRNDLIDILINFGYIRESLVTSTSEFAVRGMLIDVFPIYSENPIRVEFDGNTIETIKYFNEETQIGGELISSFDISPVSESKASVSSSLLDYMSESIVFFIDRNLIDNAYKKLLIDILEYKSKNYVTESFMYDFFDLKPKFSMNLDSFGSIADVYLESHELNNYQENFEKLKSDHDKWIREGKSVVLCLSLESQINKIKQVIPNAKISQMKINAGFIFDKLVLISEFDIERKLSVRSEYKGTFKFGKKVKSYESLEVGDYVVHINNGVGIYKGIKKLVKNGIEKDYLQIDYYGNDKVYIPAQNMSAIYKYSDKDGAKPAITKLNSSNWKKTRSYIQKKIEDISAELISLYKKRLEINSVNYLLYDKENVIFDNSFNYTLTSNQRKSVDDILSDLTSNVPMDRLLCGDVGFGKTEVAFRGMFNTVLNGFQVMYLCPTTILSSQQYNVAKERFKDWPIEIALLNRFVSMKETNIIIERLKLGKIDILFGTHRILSDDIKPKDLGLLVVDEEQRFGVKHKEKIKELRNDVNVLTLTATPIPRTLKMALSGIRDLSVIDTPPVNRYPIQTYVLAYDEMIIKDAIYKELSRNGQIFILYNKVSDITNFCDHIKKLVPEARCNFAHGQMSKIELENIMNDFIDYNFDILVCSTIIESGIDISNANTLIVYDADKFGLSQLYQIRGRVGRSDKIGYAYLFYDQTKILNEVAVKRLKAIQDFTELGSGYKIAMRDLAIRGAGDIFGASQAGFIDSIGITLYMKMIDNEVRRQRGEVVEEDDVDYNYLVDVDTHISDSFVSDEDIKIEIHKLINTIDSQETFDKVKIELIDRFGNLPENIIIYMYEEWFEKLSKKLKITNVYKHNKHIEIALPSDISSRIKGDKLLMYAYQINIKFNINYTSKEIRISLNYNAADIHYIIDYVKLLNEIVENNLIEK